MGVMFKSINACVQVPFSPLNLLRHTYEGEINQCSKLEVGRLLKNK